MVVAPREGDGAVAEDIRAGDMEDVGRKAGDIALHCRRDHQRKTIFGAPGDGDGGDADRAAVRIIAGQLDHGVIVAFSSHRELTEDDVRLLERAATVAALAITKDQAVAAVETVIGADNENGQWPRYVSTNVLTQTAVLHALGVIPANFQWPQALTSAFLHDGWIQFAPNMLYLWIFGDNVEDAMGHLSFVGFYLASAMVAAAAYAALNPSSAAPLIGASGAGSMSCNTITARCRSPSRTNVPTVRSSYGV